VPEGNGKWLEYAGGYTDMLAQRGGAPFPGPRLRGRRGPPAAKAAASIEDKPPRTTDGPSKRKLSFNEKHALEMLPGRIATLEAEIGQLHTLLADTTLYVRDRPTFDRASSALTALQSELAAAEEQWLALELKRDEIEKA
jgi:ABC transport system ATP-binding/permease protein